MSEADTRAKLVTPALHARGWVEDLIRREETPGAIVKFMSSVRREKGRMDYLLRLPAPREDGSPVTVALIEAKKNTDSPRSGMEQAKSYARRFNVPFVYSTNGYQFAEYDATTGREAAPKTMDEFPTPAMLQERYEAYIGNPLTAEITKPLSTPYAKSGESARRYYQDAAIRAALEQISRQEKEGKPKRVLLSLATGAGKTFIATNLLKRIFDAGGVSRALFLCDRDALRQQALAHFQDLFGSDAEIARRGSDGDNVAKNARIHIATYQTLGMSGDEEDDIDFAKECYPPNYFSHIIVDECHRSLRNDWAGILADNPDAVHIGLTATPKQLRKESDEDREISSRNLQYFGEPVYAYSLSQGAEDGYLALCEIQERKVNIDDTGLSIDEVLAHNPVNYRTGKPLTREELEEMYEKKDYENILMLPDRVNAMCQDLFDTLVNSGAVHHKTIIFCVRREHAEMVTSTLNNLYAKWCESNGEERADPYAFVCMSAQGRDELADFRTEDNHHIIASTVELLTTGVDVPAVRNIVFFRYVKSPIQLQQMMGRGARIDTSRDKLSFSVYDYTNATKALDEDWHPPKPRDGGSGGDSSGDEPPQIAIIGGLEVVVTPGDNYIIIADENGRQIKLNAEQYRIRMAQRVLEKVHTLNGFREIWSTPEKRKAFLQSLRNEQAPPDALAALLERQEYDGYDIIAESVYGALAMTREERAQAFRHKNKEWLSDYPAQTQKVLIALAERFAENGVQELEAGTVFDTTAVKQAGGVDALYKASAEPYKLLQEAKRRLFAA